MKVQPQAQARPQRNDLKRLKRMMALSGAMLLSLGVGVSILTDTTSWATGETVTSESRAIISSNPSDFSSLPVTFDTSIENALTELRKADPAAADTTSRFYSAYTTASQDYHTALVSAAEIYAQNSGSDPKGAKSAYIDAFSSARTAYFNELESARNAVVTDVWGQDDTARDAFVNEFNAARDHYNTQLESIKSEIASLQP